MAEKITSDVERIHSILEKFMTTAKKEKHIDIKFTYLVIRTLEEFERVYKKIEQLRPNG